jgi:hypothetical protein
MAPMDATIRRVLVIIDIVLAIIAVLLIVGVLP